jgi:hypothetical protein
MAESREDLTFLTFFELQDRDNSKLSNENEKCETTLTCKFIKTT